MTSAPTARDFLNVIRLRMKALRYTYDDAAKALGVSLPTVKRLFTGEDVPFSRVASLAAWLEMSWKDLSELVEQDALASHAFTDAQETFFAENPAYLAYLFALHQKKLTPAKIAEAHKLSRVSTNKYLTTLEKLGVVERLSDDRVRVRLNGAISWPDDGPLAAAVTRRMIRRLAESAISKMGTASDAFVHLRGVRLSRDDYERFRAELKELSRKYELVSGRKQKLSTADSGVAITFLILADAWEDSTFISIPNLKST